MWNMDTVTGTLGSPPTTVTTPPSSGTSPTGGTGNKELAASFDFAIKQASETLKLTTEKGADLYALKQRVG
jgi:hypothetical protein